MSTFAQRCSDSDSLQCAPLPPNANGQQQQKNPGNQIRSVDYLQSSSVDSHCMGKPSDLVQGTLDLLILKTVSLDPQHGWAIAKRIQQISNEVLQVQQGSLYPALHRLEQQGWIRAKWAESDTGRQAKFYSLTAAGRTQLEREKESWSRLSSAINLVVEGA
jgi:PadR family transcriptional regulator, regulatory protein PadR